MSSSLLNKDDSIKEEESEVPADPHNDKKGNTIVPKKPHLQVQTLQKIPTPSNTCVRTTILTRNSYSRRMGSNQNDGISYLLSNYQGSINQILRSLKEISST